MRCLLVDDGRNRVLIESGIGDKIDNDFRDFKEGMVTTVEPGIYIHKNDKIDPEYWNIGIRIEDDVLVTKDGHHVLSKSAVKEVKDIEYLMSQNIT